MTVSKLWAQESSRKLATEPSSEGRSEDKVPKITVDKASDNKAPVDPLTQIPEAKKSALSGHLITRNLRIVCSPQLTIETESEFEQGADGNFHYVRELSFSLQLQSPSGINISIFREADGGVRPVDSGGRYVFRLNDKATSLAPEMERPQELFDIEVRVYSLKPSVLADGAVQASCEGKLYLGARPLREEVNLSSYAVVSWKGPGLDKTSLLSASY